MSVGNDEEGENNKHAFSNSYYSQMYVHMYAHETSKASMPMPCCHYHLAHPMDSLLYSDT